MKTPDIAHDDGLEVPNNNTLLTIAARYLNTRGRAEVNKHLDAGKAQAAQQYIGGALTQLWNTRRLSQEEAQEAFRDLGLSGKYMAMKEHITMQ